VALADGSIARLAPDSAISVTYAANRREVRLLKGEAWFDVRHDPGRPFYVNAKGVTTTVLGTAFDVRMDQEGVTAELVRGQVRVAYGGGSAPPISEQLAPGETVRVGFDGAVIVRDDGFEQQRVTGIYNAADPVEALHGLTRAYGGSVSTVTPWVILLSSNQR
jgi:transmembrane sensor